MQKVADFATYQRLRKMSYNDLNRWLISFYTSAYSEGHSNAETDIVTISEEQLREILLSIKGIGTVRTDQIIWQLKNLQAQKAEHNICSQEQRQPGTR